MHLTRPNQEEVTFHENLLSVINWKDDTSSTTPIERALKNGVEGEVLEKHTSNRGELLLEKKEDVP